MKPKDNSPLVQGKPVQLKALQHQTMQLKMFFITALMAVLGFAFISPFFDATPYSDSPPQVLVYEAQESFGDAEPITPDTNLGAFFTYLSLFFASVLLVELHTRREVAPRLNFLYHIRPRSPPVH